MTGSFGILALAGYLLGASPPVDVSVRDTGLPPELRMTVPELQDVPSWEFEIMPYFWASGLSGMVRPLAGAPTISFERSFSEIFEDVDAAVFVSFAAQRDRVVLLGDLGRVVSSREGTLPNGLPASGGTKQTSLTLLGGYTVLPRPRASVDLVGGFRATWLEADVTVAGGVLSASPSRSLLDPVVGARGIALLSPRWSAHVHADVGGFGVGSEWSNVISGMLDLHLSEHVAVSAGYRSMWVDYDKENTLVDVTIGGPVLGASWRF